MVDRAMEEFGQVDILLNNAAVPGKDLYVWEQTLENWNATIAVDLTAAMLCSREVLNRSMLERRTGSIINFSSTAGWNGIPRKTHYVSAKAALRALTKTIALEVGPYGIRCNCLVPGGIETELWVNWGKRMAGEQGITFEEWKETAWRAWRCARSRSRKTSPISRCSWRATRAARSPVNRSTVTPVASLLSRP